MIASTDRYQPYLQEWKNVWLEKIIKWLPDGLHKSPHNQANIRFKTEIIMDEWQTRCKNTENRQTIFHSYLKIRELLKKKVNFETTQILTGHCKFCTGPQKIGKFPDGLCYVWGREKWVVGLLSWKHSAELGELYTKTLAGLLCPFLDSRTVVTQNSAPSDILSNSPIIKYL